MKLQLSHKTISGTAPVDEEKLSEIALRYAGDNGMTVAGTAAAIEWQARVRSMSPGQAMDIPKTKYIITALEEAA